MSGKGDKPRPVNRSKYESGYRMAFGYWDCSKCGCTDNRRDVKKCIHCGAKRVGSSKGSYV